MQNTKHYWNHESVKCYLFPVITDSNEPKKEHRRHNFPDVVNGAPFKKVGFQHEIGGCYTSKLGAFSKSKPLFGGCMGLLPSCNLT
jgi:hypothetical protein